MRDRARNRRRALLATTILVVLALAAGTNFFGSGDSAASDRLPESFDESGFAIWPEDSAEAGLKACRERSDSEPWRLAAEDTATHFAREVFGWPRVELGVDFDARPDRLRVLAYGAPSRLDLGNLIVAFRYGDCWFVSFVDYREGGPFPDQNLVLGATGGTVLELNYPHLVDSGFVMEAGYGGTSRRVEGHSRLRVRALPGATGHYLAAFVNKDGVTLAAAGGPLPVAPDLGAHMEPIAHGGFALYPDADPAYARKTCRNAESYLDYGRHAREPLISFAMDVLEVARSNKDRRIQTSNLEGTPTWLMQTPRLDFRFDTTRTPNGCVMLTDVTTPRIPIDVRVSVGQDVVRLDLGSVKAATIEVRLGFGDQTSLETKARSPLFVPLRVDKRETGYYIVLLKDERGRLMAAEGHALQGPTS
jgi:hypothetical protein